MSEPKWMQTARDDIGTKEIPGSKHNPKIVQYFKDVKQGGVRDDETSWCAAFVGSHLERSGVQSTRSLLARSYLKWGSPTTDPQPGDIVVFKRGSSTWQGHVGFFVKKDGKGIHVLGGNQGNSVSIAVYSTANLLGYRKAPKSVNPTPAKISDQVWQRALSLVKPHASSITLSEYAISIGQRLSDANQSEIRRRRDGATADEINLLLWKNYWEPSGCTKLPEEAAIFTFDTAIHHGAHKAKQVLQRALGVKDDGLIGPKTIDAAKKADKVDLLKKMQLKRIELLKQRDDWDVKLNEWNLAMSRIVTSLVGPGGIVVAETMRPISNAVMPAEHGETYTINTKEIEMTDNAVTTSKPWTQSLTIWGVIVTFVSSVMPVLAQVFGWDIGASDVQEVGTQVTTIMQAVGGLVGTVMAILGRVKATAPVKLF